jgi:hypothetical protein
VELIMMNHTKWQLDRRHAAKTWWWAVSDELFWIEMRGSTPLPIFWLEYHLARELEKSWQKWEEREGYSLGPF